MRKILVTGGTGVVGKKLTVSLIKEGHQVFCTTKSGRVDTVFSEELRKSEKLRIIRSDFSAPLAVEELVNQLPPDLDAVVFNARSVENLKMGEEGIVSSEKFLGELQMAVVFPYEVIMSMIRQQHKLKDVIFISSMYGVVAPTPALYDNFKTQSPVNYGVAKAAQVHLTKELAVRLADRRIRVNCISYGGIQGRTDAAFRERYASLNPMRRMLTEDDIYPPVEFILNNPGLALNGENLMIDGGWTLS
jgi:hypothetical protein